MRDMQLSVQYLSMFVSRTLSISMSMPLLCRSEWRCVSIHGSGWCCVHVSGWLHRCSMVNDRVEFPRFKLICRFVVKSRCFLAIPIHVSRSLWSVVDGIGMPFSIGLNKGVCLYDPITLTMTCQCCGLATGRSLIDHRLVSIDILRSSFRFCEILLNPCNTSIPYCFNGATCVLDAASNPMCVCPTNFTGIFMR